MKERKEVSIHLFDQVKEHAKFIKDGWTIVGYGFAPEGPTHSLVILEREKEAKVAAPHPKPKTVATISVPKKTKAKPKGKKKGSK